MGSGSKAKTAKPNQYNFLKREGKSAVNDLRYLSDTGAGRQSTFDQFMGIGAPNPLSDIAGRRSVAVDALRSLHGDPPLASGQPSPSGGSFSSREDFARQFGVDANQLNLGIQTGGVVPFGKDTLASFDAARNFRGPNFGGALGDLGAIDYGGIGGDVDALRNFKLDPSVARGISGLEDFRGSAEAFGQLDRLNAFDAADPSQAQDFLADSASGRYLDEANPYLGDFIEASQRRLSNNFRENILPDIGAQFGASGAFNNSMRVPLTTQAARDLQEQLGDIDTRLSFDVYNTERQLMEQARGRLADDELARRGLNLEALTAGLGGAIDLSGQELSAKQSALQGGLSASQIRQAALDSALQGSLGLGDLRLGSAGLRADIANSQARSELDRISLLSQIGQKQDSLTQALALAPQARQDARFNELQQFNALVNPGGGGGAAAPGTNRLASGIGGAVTGATLGSSFGPVGTIAGGIIGGAGGFLA